MPNPLVTLVVAGMLASAPWFFGGVGPLTQAVLLSVAAVLVLIYAFSGRRTESKGWLSTVEILLGLAVALAVLQLIPLPTAVADVIAPGLVKLRHEYDPPSQKDTWVTLSMYPPSTRSHLGLLLLVTTVLAVSARAARSERFVQTVLVVGLATGAAVALFGIVQKLTWNGMVYWRIPLVRSATAFAAMNRNNTGGLLCLSLACGMGLFLWKRDGKMGRTSGNGGLSAGQIYLLGASAFVLAGIFASASRGAVGAALFSIGMVASCLLVLGRRPKQAAGVVAGAACALTLTIWLGQYDEVRNRFDGMWEQHEAPLNGRLDNWADALRSVPESLFVGHGLHTYRFAYPRFQRRNTGGLFRYAENIYVQTLVDAGMVGLILLVLCVALVAISIVALFRHPQHPNLAVATAGLAATSSQLFAASFDFGLYLPSNAMLLAALSGLVIGRDAWTRFVDSPREGEARVGRPGFRRVIPISRSFAFKLALVLSAGLLVASVDNARRAIVQRNSRRPTLTEIGGIQDDAPLRAAIASARDALPYQWDDAEAQQRLAELYKQRIRVAYFDVLRREQPWLDEQPAWESSAFDWIQSLYADRETRAGLLAFFGSTAVKPVAAAAWSHARLSRRHCPWRPSIHYLLAELGSFVGDEPLLTEHLDRAQRLGPGEATVWYWSGVYAAIAGDEATALADWKHTLELNWGFGPAIASRAAKLADPDWKQLLPASPELHLRMAKQLKATGELEQARQVAELGLRQMAEVGQLTGDEVGWQTELEEMAIE